MESDEATQPLRVFTLTVEYGDYNNYVSKVCDGFMHIRKLYKQEYKRA